MRASVLALALLLAGPAVAEAAAVERELHPRLTRLAASRGQDHPLVRIGLEPQASVRLSSAAPYRVLDVATGEEVWRASFEGELRVVADGVPEGGVPSVWRVQVGAFETAEAAATELERLSALVDAQGVVHHDPDRGNWRVRLGRSTTRDALDPLVERLRAAGVEGAWLAEEPGASVEGLALRLVDRAWESHRAASPRLVAVPQRGAWIEVEGKPYRGVIELRLSPFGTVRPIDWVGLEDYLLGVVPAELGPAVWPELEALRAQAVAARTYLWRNLGQFEEEGFDVCATPRCQVYGGASAEHPLSSQAVADTHGEVLVWEGEPILALYTATCGGHTEDGSAMFSEHAEPYLTGVPCRAEEPALERARVVLAGRAPEPVIDETGADVTREWALLAASGIVDPAVAPGAPVESRELRAWTRALTSRAGLPAPEGAPHPTATLAQAALALARDIGWQERARVLLSNDDVPALLRDPRAADLPEDERRALAYLAWAEALRPDPTGRFGAEEPASRARLAAALARAGLVYRPYGLAEAQVVGPDGAALLLTRDGRDLSLRLAERPWLFSRSGGRSSPAESLLLWPGDRVRYRTGGDGRIDFLELEPPVKGLDDDRHAAVYAWEVRKTRRELEEAIARRVSVGRLVDLEILRRGVSGRVVELRVVGSGGSTVVRGFDVRRLLDLREILLVMDVQRDAEGEIDAVVFAGKGWGHGVGLCQVGAYGMALRGAGYREILAHYYRGAELRPVARR